jgi:mRNA surveillance protein pelota
MKILDRNMKQGLVKVVVEAADDLWYLSTIIDKGDVCTGDSEYKYKVGAGSGGDSKTSIVKRKVWVALDVERAEFSTSDGQLRVSGKVVDGSEEVPRGSHHTLDLTEGSRITIRKERWLEYHLEKLEEALSARATALLVLFDREQAIFATLTPTGHEILLTLKGDVPRKGVDEGKAHAFYKEVADATEDLCRRKGAQHVIAASPSFWKEYLERELAPELRKRTLFTTISTVDETAINEVLRRPELQSALRAQRSTREAALLEGILTALAKDRLVYGKADVKAALEEGNASEVTVSENAIRKAKEEGTFDELDGLMRSASSIKAAVHLLSTKDAMAKIDGLGGIVGIKRW